MADDYDWTKGGEQDPYEKYDNVAVGGNIADGKSLAKVDEEGEMGPPLGPRTLVIDGMALSEHKETKEPQEVYKECWLNGEKKGYTTFEMFVFMHDKENPSKTIRDRFVLPPGMGSDPSKMDHLDLYMTATSKDVKPTGNNVAVHWNRLKNFLGHAGMPIGDGGQIAPFTGKQLRYWPSGAPREIVGTVEIQKGDGDKKYKNIAFRSYKTAESTMLYQANPGQTYATPSGNGSQSKPQLQTATVADDVEDVDI